MAHDSSVAERHRSKQNRATIFAICGEVQMQPEPSRLLSRKDIEQLLSLGECMDAVEKVFRSSGEGKIWTAGILGVKTANGSLHVKTASFSTDRNYIVAKL